jgi:phosphoenolpyruvate carboxykinase (GTP)
VLDRCSGKGKAVETPIGWVPTRDAIDTKGLDLPDNVLTELLKVDVGEWEEALKGQADYFGQFGDRLPAGMREEHEGLAKRLRTATASKR